MLKSERGKNIQVKHVCESTCKYYRQKQETFNINHLGPKGICLDLYHAAYPYGLALLHGAEFSWMEDKNAVHAQCPAPGENVHFEVRRKPLEQEVISKGVKKKNLILITIKDIAGSTGKYENDCICSQKPGQQYEFNQGDLLDQMCPAAFYNIWPTLKIILNSGKNPWIKDNNVYVRCPDNIPKITFEISKNEVL